jgi:hypothetical protein
MYVPLIVQYIEKCTELNFYVETSPRPITKVAGAIHLIAKVSEKDICMAVGISNITFTKHIKIMHKMLAVTDPSHFDFTH